MTDPATLTPPPRPDTTSAVIRLILAVVFAIPGIGGLLVLALIFLSWMISGFHFPIEDRDFMIIFSILAMVFIVGSALSIGIVLRYSHWARAPALSLGLSLTVLFSVLVSIAMFPTTFEPTDFESWYLLILAGMAGLTTGALPPFLHWRRDSR